MTAILVSLIVLAFVAGRWFEAGVRLRKSKARLTTTVSYVGHQLILPPGE